MTLLTLFAVAICAFGLLGFVVPLVVMRWLETAAAARVATTISLVGAGVLAVGVLLALFAASPSGGVLALGVAFAL